MTLLGNGFRRILLLAVIAICVILIALNIVLNIKLRSDIPGLIEQFSKETPYNIEVENISLDALFRLQFDNVSITDPSLDKKDVLDVDQVTVRPHILSSLFGQRIVLGEIVLHDPQVQSNKENIENLRDFIESITKDRDKDQEQAVEIRAIKIVDGDFYFSADFLVSVPNLSVELSERNLEKGQRISYSGIIDLLQKKVALDGSVIVSEQTTGKLNIKIEEISSPSLLSDSDILSAASEISFMISDLITLKGELVINAEEGFFSEKSLAEANYSVDYDPDSDTASITSFNFGIPDLIQGSFSGKINKVTKETIFNLTGQTDQLNIGDLMVQIFGDDRGLLSGEFTTKNLKVTGSRAKGDIQLSGDGLLESFNFKSEKEDDPKVSKVDCKLKINQNLDPSANFSLTSNGTCSAQMFLWDKTGPVDNLKARVAVSSKNKWSDNKIALSSITSSYMDGIATGSLNFFLEKGFGGGITTISGDINGSNLNLEKTPKAIIPANIAGLAQTASAKFEGGSNNYKANISIAVNDFVLKSKEEREFRVARIRSTVPVDFEYKSLNQKQSISDQEEILVKGGGVNYERLSFEEYNINSGTVKDFDFLLELGRDRWGLNIASQGSGFTIEGHDVSLESFSESLSIPNSGREGFKGTVSGAGGRYKSVDFPTLSWDYNFVGDRIIVSNVNTQISTIGEFKTDELYVGIGSQAGGYPYNVDFEDATFTGFEGKLVSQGIKGEFSINKPGSTDLDWIGNVSITQTTMASAVINNISNKVIPTPGGIKLQGITGRFLGGEVSGNIDIDTTRSPSGIEVALKLLNASASSDSLVVKMPLSELTFSGTLPNGSLPEGNSNLVLKNIVLENNDVSTKLNSNIKARTVAETLYVDQGFIRDINNQSIKFTGQMTDSLNENRTLELKFPEVPIQEALGMLSPLVPGDFRSFKSKGYAEMDLIFHHLFYPEGRWSGKLSLRGGSFSGDYGGAPLVIDDVYGTITLKDKVSSENPLAHFMNGNLKLSKSIFQKFLKSFNETNLNDEELDFLNIKRIQYGILEFENIECALEVDRQKINLRRLLSKLFRGSFYGAGLIEFGQDQSTYNFSLIFNQISLESISERVSPGQEYITGRINGLVWINGEGAELNTIDGPFKFWSKRSSKEQRRIGAALLAKMGARERLILGSSRGYDNGNISGYINDGLITFREFEISNSFLGIRNLTIQADSVRNSITISQLVSTVRELSRRSESGLPMIETN